MKFCWTTLLLISLFFTIDLTAQTYQNNTAYPSSNYVRIPSYTDGELRNRISQMMSTVIPPRFDNVVKSYINTYTVKKRQRTEGMLGRSVMYFPIFEKYMREQNMPLDLKYLSVVESALNPNAVSRSGAVGLWQFMPPTGKERGLRINSTVDERRDPNKSTKAALNYLSALYRKFGNWPLALAAYNGGPGRVSRAVKRGRSKNYWRIRKYLPKETRNYVPAFIAATYIMHYYQLHNLQPHYPEYDLQYTSAIKVYRNISFKEIERITGTPRYIIEELNPSYKKAYIPHNRRGNFLILPQAKMGAMLSHLGRPDGSPVFNIASSSIPAPSGGVKRMNTKPAFVPVWNKDEYIKTTYTTKEGDNLDLLAKVFNCKPESIRFWNSLSSNSLRKGQEIVLYYPKKNKAENFSLVSIPSLKPKQVASINKFDTRLSSSLRARSTVKKVKQKKSRKSKSSKSTKSTKHSFKRSFSKVSTEQGDYIYYKVKRRDTLWEIAEKYPDVSLRDIIELNGIDAYNMPKPGTRIKIKKR